uniref:Uncharacterized protein n=1 Tax=Salmo trutta TaxID=8032 RepID=A0A674CC75_SALTR
MAVNKRIKYLLFLFNVLFWISGCIILGVSIYLKVSLLCELTGLEMEWTPNLSLLNYGSFFTCDVN